MSSALLPTNFGPMLLVGYAFLDGSPPDTSNANLGIYYDVDMVYQDE